VIRPIDPPIPRGTVSPLVFVPRDPPPESGPGHFTLSLCLERVDPMAPSCRASPTSRRSRSVQVGRSRRRRESAGFSITCALSLFVVSDTLTCTYLRRVREYICYLYYKNLAAVRSNRNRV